MALLDETQSSLLEVLQRMMRTMSTEESSSFSRSGARDDASLSTRRRRVYSYGGRRGTPKKSLEPYLKDQLTEPKVLVLSKDDFLNNKTSTKRRPFVVAAAAASPRRRRAPGGLDDDLDDLDDDEGDAAASARKEDDEEEAYALTTLSIKHDIIEFAIDEQDDEETNVFAADASSHFDGDGSEERPSFYDDDDVARAMHEQAACLEATLAATNDAKKTHDAVVAAYTAALAAKARATAGRVDVEVADTLLCRSRVQYRSGKLDAAEADQLQAVSKACLPACLRKNKFRRPSCVGGMRSAGVALCAFVFLKTHCHLALSVVPEDVPISRFGGPALCRTTNNALRQGIIMKSS